MSSRIGSNRFCLLWKLCYNKIIESPNYTYKDVVDYILAYASESGEALTNLKLQKILYYTQAWHLANFNRPLFQEDFEAWVHGPVIPELYHELKIKGAAPIQHENKLEETRKKFDAETMEYLDEVISVYLPFGAYQLELMTHREDPWIEARKNCDPDDRCTEVIKKLSMQRFYGSKIQV